jgi:hypothetical protein
MHDTHATLAEHRRVVEDGAHREQQRKPTSSCVDSRISLTVAAQPLPPRVGQLSAEQLSTHSCTPSLIAVTPGRLALHADSQSASAQSFFPAHVQNATASHQSIWTTGSDATPGHPEAGTNEVLLPHPAGWPAVEGFAAMNVAYCPFVTSVASTQNAPAFTGVGPPVEGHEPEGASEDPSTGSPPSVVLDPDDDVVPDVPLDAPDDPDDEDEDALASALPFGARLSKSSAREHAPTNAIGTTANTALRIDLERV